MKSMTGFGCCEKFIDGKSAIISIKISSVNRKKFDLRCNIAPELMNFEPTIRKLISERVQRGMVSVKVSLALTPEAYRKNLKINKRLAGSYLSKIRSLQESINLGGEVSVDAILNLPGVLEIPDDNLPIVYDKDCFEKILSDALNLFIESKQTEGKKIHKDLKNRFKHLQKIYEKMAPECEDSNEVLKKRLSDKLKNAGLASQSYQDRLARELVLYADKVDVSEELTRLKSHLSEFEKFLNSEKSLGRNMDFLIQEILREITTLGNKAASPKVSPEVVEFKTELEKMREQIQNIE